MFGCSDMLEKEEMKLDGIESERKDIQKGLSEFKCVDMLRKNMLNCTLINSPMPNTGYAD